MCKNVIWFLKVLLLLVTLENIYILNTVKMLESIGFFFFLFKPVHSYSVLVSRREYRSTWLFLSSTSRTHFPWCVSSSPSSWKWTWYVSILAEITVKKKRERERIYCVNSVSDYVDTALGRSGRKERWLLEARQSRNCVLCCTMGEWTWNKDLCIQKARYQLEQIFILVSKLLFILVYYL